MKVLLVYGYGAQNAGDMAITYGAIDMLLEKGHDVTVMSRFSTANAEYANSLEMLTGRYGESIRVVPCVFTLDRGAGPLLSAGRYLKSLLVLMGLGKAAVMKKLVKDSDFVVFNGGNLLRCAGPTDILRLLALDYPLSIARKYGRPYGIMPQSTAGINRRGRRIIARMLESAEFAFTRESVSLSRLREIYPEGRTALAADLAFFIRDQRQTTPAASGAAPKIAVTLRGWSMGDLSELAASKRQAICDYFSKLFEDAPAGAGLVFVSQTAKDTPLTRKCAETLSATTGREIQCIEKSDPIELGRFYAGCDLLIGMRLHSIILACARGTPAFGVFFREWGDKNPGLMTDLKLDYTYLDEDEERRFPDIQSIMDHPQQFGQSMEKYIARNIAIISEVI